MVIALLFQLDQQPQGRALHLVLISVTELYLTAMANRVRRLHQSKALWVLMATFIGFVLSNLGRVLEFGITGRFPLLEEFSLSGSVSLVMNYLSAIFYCYGYWGFVVEKNRRQLVHATEQTVLARENEKLALEREQLAKDVLRERTEMLEHMATIGKLAQSGALSAAISHEINQPLAAIQLNIEESRRLAMESKVPEILHTLLHNVQRDNQRAAAIVQRVRAMFSQRQVKLQNLRFDELLDFVLECMQRRLRLEHVQVTCKLHPQSTFLFTAGEMEHILMNLLENAIQALQQHPTNDRHIEISSWREPGWFWISVADNGPGVPEALSRNIFALSESSKTQGMGVGLWLARYIVERHDGKITLDETFGRGARFMVQLPDHQAQNPAIV